MSSENIDKLQLLQNHAARLIFGTKKREHITPILFKLHWLPIRQRIEYKVALLCFKCIHNIAPIYLQNLIEIYTPSRSLRSASDKFCLKKVTMKYKSYGEKSFSFYGPTSSARSILNGKRCVRFFPLIQCLKITQTSTIGNI